MKTIIIAPYSRKLRNGKRNPKDFPYWDKVLENLNKNFSDIKVIQIGRSGEDRLPYTNDFITDLPLDQLQKLIEKCDVWISVDSFLQHLAAHTNRTGIVIFGKSDPNLFGYKRNINLLKSRTYLRDRQFSIWEEEAYDESCFVSPNTVVETIKKHLGI